MPAPDRRKNRIPRKSKRRIVTVNDLFTREDINGMLSRLEKEKANIKDLLIIWEDKDGNHHWDLSEDTMQSVAVWMLERTKLEVMLSNEFTDDEED